MKKPKVLKDHSEYLFFSLTRDSIPHVIILGIRSTVPLSAQFSELLLASVALLHSLTVMFTHLE